MRQFMIKNAKGQVFDMNREDAFFSDPKGLGTDRTTTYQNVGYSYAEKSNILKQKNPYGDMVFDGYEQYDEFAAILRYTPLTLMYTPLDTTYYMDVNTYTLEKTEISEKDGWLTCRVDFEGLTPWYTVSTYASGSTGGSARTYDYSYSYTYTDTSTGKVTITNNSGLDAYCRLIIYGPCDTPAWTLYQVGELVSDGKMNSTVDDGYKLIVNSNPLEYEIGEYDLLDQFVSDRYAESDFDTTRFLEIPPGTSTFRISHAGSNDLEYILEVTVLVG